MDNGQRPQQRRKAITRERILQAAIELAHEEGWPNLTMRRIAERIQYTHPALYAYFATKEELLLALLRHGVHQLHAALEAARQAAPNPEAALWAIVEAYWNFARHHSELYQVMHGLGGVAFTTAEVQPEERQVGDPVAAVIRELLAHHGQEPGDVDRKVVLLWSNLHGLVTLTMAGRFDHNFAEELTHQMLCDTLVAWGIR
jgi:AcrR family transcriptional regulator